MGTPLANQVETHEQIVNDRFDRLERRVSSIEARFSDEPPVEIEPQPEPPDSTSGGIGVNLGGGLDQLYWNTAHIFNNAFLQAKPWDKNNQSYIWWDYPEAMPKGDLRLIYDGPGDVEIKRTANGVLITRSGGEVVDERIRILMPGVPGDSQVVYTDSFIDSFGHIGETLRFMDWLGTNNEQTQFQSLDTEFGSVSLREMVLLCNITKSVPWFNMGHLWTDFTIWSFAELVKEWLDPGIPIRVAWSNEPWNGIFPQHHWAKSQGLHDTWAGHSKAVWDIWRDVFSDQPERIIRVLETQAAAPWHAKQLMDRLETTPGNTPGNTSGATSGGGFDELAIAGYFGVSHKLIGQVDDVDDLFAVLPEGLEVAKDRYVKHAELARQAGVPMVAYEGGPHLGFNWPADKKHLAWQASRDPRIYDVTLQNLENWKAAGGGVFCAYHHIGQDKEGDWGHRLYQDQPISEAHKERALLAYQGIKA